MNPVPAELKRIHFFIIILMAIFCVNSALAEEPTHLRFGVLSLRPKEITMAQWVPLAQEIERNLPAHTVELFPMTYSELDKATKEKQLDFVLTSPEHYILLKNRLGMSAIATLIRLEKGHPLTHYAGVIFTRTDREDIQTLSDLNNKVIASSEEQSFGGYLMQRWELKKNQIAVKSYDFTGMPQDKVIDEVLNGKADAGFVRSGVLEKLEQSGKISLGENASVRVLNSLPMSDNMPVLHSTEYYPEWTFAVSSHVSTDISRKVSLVLLNIELNSNVAKAAGIAGFIPPADYTPVEILMLRLHIHPEKLKDFNFKDVIWRYRGFVAIGIAVVLLIFVLIIFLVRANRQLKTTKISLHEYYAEMSLLLNSMAEGAYGVDNNGFCRFVNDAFLKILGYKNADEVMGKHIHELIHHSHIDGTPYPSETCKMYNAYRQHRNIHVSDEVFWRKDGIAVPVEYWSQPIIADGVVKGAIATFMDITERKKDEDLILKLAFFDPLTGLPNRRKLLDRINYEIAISHREGKKFAVFMMDLDKFKAVNDSLGHAAGDDLLKQVAIRVTACLRESDMVARLGGDEFVIVLESLNDIETAHQVASKVIKQLTVPFELLKGEKVQIGASIGISLYPEHGDASEKLLDRADTALYQAKDNGRGHFVYYYEI
ncbi:MAG: diguanylate cyclase [Methylococcales bacterium]|nr:diguanylate cyclase [Methylococcales bacterium]MDD5754034.1 diguanylate cyclase [Methylococcales bacterium]